jgi:hypothetical protein
MQSYLNQYFQHISGSDKFDCIELVNMDSPSVISDLSKLLKNDDKHKLFDIERIIVRHCRLDGSELEYYRTITSVSEHLNTAIFIEDEIDPFQAVKFISALHDTPLTSLVFKEQWLNGEKDLPALLRAIAKNKHIQSLDLSLDWLGDEGIAMLGKQLQTMTYLSHLDISCNGFNKVGLKTFLQHVVKHPALSSLDLSYNYISADNAKYIETLLIKNNVLTNLNLQSNHLQDDGIDYLINALKKNHTLKILNLGDNQITEEQLIKLIHSVMNFKSIDKLYISNNHADKESINKLIQFISKKNNKLRIIA